MIFELIHGAYHYVNTHPITTQLVVAASLAVYFLILKPFYISPLRHIPGPYLHRISTVPALNGQRAGVWSETVYNLHLKYGDAVILSPTEISVNGSPKYINDICVKNFPKSPYYQNFKNHGSMDNIFATLDNDQHLRYKRMIMGLYSKSAIYNSKNPIRNQINEKTFNLLKQVHTSSVTGEHPDYINAESKFNEHGKGYTVGKHWFNKSNRKSNLGIDVFSLFGSLAMDLVSTFELGVSNGTNFLLDPNSRSMILFHRSVASMGFWTCLMPKLWNIAAGPKIIEAVQKVENWQLNLYNNAELNVPETKTNENKTTLETLKSKGFKEKAAYSFLSDNIFAGHETTAIQLTYITYELSRTCHRDKLRKLQNELRQTFGKPQNDTDLITDFEILDKLPYLNALMDENSRIHSSIPGAEPRIVNKPYSVEVPGKGLIKIPIGTIISVLPFAIHRQKDFFPDPDHFIPERWIKSDDESEDDYKLRITNQQKYMMPFGKGIRMCLGMQLAVTEMKMAIANLYWHYSSEIDSDWCTVVEYTDQKVNTIKHGDRNKGQNQTDEEKMTRYDSYTTRPVNDECWLRWFKY